MLVVCSESIALCILLVAIFTKCRPFIPYLQCPVSSSSRVVQYDCLLTLEKKVSCQFPLFHPFRISVQALRFLWLLKVTVIAGLHSLWSGVDGEEGIVGGCEGGDEGGW